MPSLAARAAATRLQSMLANSPRHSLAEIAATTSMRERGIRYSPPHTAAETLAKEFVPTSQTAPNEGQTRATQVENESWLQLLYEEVPRKMKHKKLGAGAGAGGSDDSSRFCEFNGRAATGSCGHHLQYDEMLLRVCVETGSRMIVAVLRFVFFIQSLRSALFGLGGLRSCI